MVGLAHQGFSLEWEQILIWISLPTVCCLRASHFSVSSWGGLFYFPCTSSSFMCVWCICDTLLWLLLSLDRNWAQQSRAETVVLPQLLQFRGFVVINSSPQLAEKLYPNPSFESLWGLWRSKEVGSSILLWCINKENFLYFYYHCSCP